MYEQKASHIIHIVTDCYSGGKLLDAVGRRKRFVVADWEAIAVQLLGAVSFLHTVGAGGSLHESTFLAQVERTCTYNRPIQHSQLNLIRCVTALVNFSAKL